MNKVEGGKISGGQLMAMLVLARFVPVTIEYPLITGIKSPRDAWISAFFASVLSLLVIIPVTRLGLKFPDKSIIEYSQVLLGKYPGKVLGYLLVFYWISVAATVARSVGEAYTTAIMPETPILVFMLVMVFLSANAARNGLEVISRVAEINLYVMTFLGLIIIGLPYKLMRFENLLPIMADGLGPVIEATKVGVSFYSELTVLGMLVPYLKRPQDVTRYSIYAILIAGLTMTVFSISLVAVFGPTVSSFSLPAFSLGRVISIGQFLERIEVIPMGAWTITAAIKLALYVWASAVGLAQLSGLSRYQSLVYPLGAIAASLGMLFFESFVSLELSFRTTWVFFSLVVAFGTTLVLYLLALMRKSSLRPGG
ncbi:MAG TPA: endospore germination permease [Firmicutes bacterium]|nr:endospore germination permease [Candidatus Fermentithermobacillaceae bacterium]